MTSPFPGEIYCPSCHSHFFLDKAQAENPPQFCAFCGAGLYKDTDMSTIASTREISSEDVSIIQGHIPETSSIQFTIGPYQILKIIGKGGMGEVYLAYDTICGRRIALKRIRPDLKQHKNLFNRFIKEARITSQLTHPAIIPIYAIHEDKELIYYTMPYVEGETLKEIIRKAKRLEKRGEKTDSVGGTIPSLTRVLLHICQAIAYAHSHGVLHRDIKPENVIVGKFGEVMILDWGLAKLMEAEEKPIEEDIASKPSIHELTHIGKVVGTVSYMAPERGRGGPSTIQSDIYSLGVILYWILTLHAPFHRGSLQEFRQKMDQERWIEPSEIAPYRDVPQILSQICKRCLEPEPKQRYQSVNQMIHDLETFLEGRAEWFIAAKLNIQQRSDWEFQENVLIAEHIAITRGAETSDWVSLMISKQSFGANILMEAKVKIGSRGHGIGFLLSVPEANERKHLNDGYCLWIASEKNRATKLLRSTVEVLNAPEVYLKEEEWHQIKIEKVENVLRFFFNDVLQFTYVGHIPLLGTHVGLLARDADFEIEDFTISLGNQSATVSCLAVPDAFLAHRDYETALTEYRRIGYAFPGRAEGREALFRAGITLLEKGRHQSDPTAAKSYFELSLEEFEKLHETPGAPLEYLGKALVYKTLQDYDEEVKCYMLAYRRYPHHPLMHILQEQIVYRMHECSRYDRQATYQLILLVNRHIPAVTRTAPSRKLFASLKRHWEPLPFILDDTSPLQSNALMNISFSIPLSFWLGKPYFIEEILKALAKHHDLHLIQMNNALFALLELGAADLAEKCFEMTLEARPETERPLLEESHKILNAALMAHRGMFANAIEEAIILLDRNMKDEMFRLIFYILDQALEQEKPEIVHQIANALTGLPLTFDQRLRVEAADIWAYLIEKSWEEAGRYFANYPVEFLSKETSILNFLYGCWLAVTEGTELARIHFSSTLEVPFPRSWTLGAHYLDEKLGDPWFKDAFPWEKKQLNKQLSLFYHCIGDNRRSQEFKGLQ